MTPTPDADAPSLHSEKSPTEIASEWLAQISAAEKAKQEWEKRGDKITKRYRQQSEAGEVNGIGAKFNVFWANVDTLSPATYSRRPKVEVFRRFNDQDPIGRLAATILERALQYEIDCDLGLHETMKSVVLDRLIPGRGVAWLRYEATFTKETVDTPSPVDPLATTPTVVESVETERSRIDYVYWKDFLHGPGRVWADTPWVARRLPFSKTRLHERFAATITKFGGNISTVPCTYDSAKTGEDTWPSAAGKDDSESTNRALVYEIWNKETKQAIWVAKGVDTPLDIVDDPLELEEFFPCPRPLFATMTNDELTPIPDYYIYKDQLRELDNLSSRISLLTDALRVVGVYDASQASLQTLLQAGSNNRMVPVNQWAAFAEKGGLKGLVDFLPMDMIAKVLEGLYTAREATKQTIYELTGMADIIRGASKASETLGAQQIKSKFANLRLSSRQQQVAEFMTRLLQLKAEVMCTLYSEETLLKISSADQIAEAAAHPERVPQAMQLLKSDRLRHYRIEVAADSMLEPDEAQERERRDSFMSTVSNFMNAVKNIAGIAPEMMPVALEMLKYTVRGFSVGRSLEASIDDAADKVKARLAKPPPQEPSEAEVKMKLEQMNQAHEKAMLQLKEDAATDRAELDATLQLTLHNLETKLMAVAQGTQALDASLSPEPPPQPAPQLPGAPQ